MPSPADGEAVAWISASGAWMAKAVAGGETLDQTFDLGNFIDGAVTGNPFIVGEGATDGMLRVYGDDGDVWLDSSGSFMFRPDNDNANFVKVHTPGNIPTIEGIGTVLATKRQVIPPTSPIIGANGFVQGVLWVTGTYTLSQLRDQTRKKP